MLKDNLYFSDHNRQLELNKIINIEVDKAGKRPHADKIFNVYSYYFLCLLHNALRMPNSTTRQVDTVNIFENLVREARDENNIVSTAADSFFFVLRKQLREMAIENTERSHTSDEIYAKTAMLENRVTLNDGSKGFAGSGLFFKSNNSSLELLKPVDIYMQFVSNRTIGASSLVRARILSVLDKYLEVIADLSRFNSHVYKHTRWITPKKAKIIYDYVNSQIFRFIQDNTKLNKLFKKYEIIGLEDNSALVFFEQKLTRFLGRNPTYKKSVVTLLDILWPLDAGDRFGDNLEMYLCKQMELAGMSATDIVVFHSRDCKFESLEIVKDFAKKFLTEPRMQEEFMDFMGTHCFHLYKDPKRYPPVNREYFNVWEQKEKTT